MTFARWHSMTEHPYRHVLGSQPGPESGNESQHHSLVWVGRGLKIIPFQPPAGTPFTRLIQALSGTLGMEQILLPSLTLG